MVCVEDFIKCCKDKKIGNALSKAKLRAFIAATSEPTVDIGRAALKGYWNFESPVYNELKKFLKDLAEYGDITN